MQSELLELGSALKRRRQERNLSFREIESGTSIRTAYLEAIEQGEIGKLISPVYAQGFIRKYASFLEIDPESLIRTYPHVMKILNEQRPFQKERPLGLPVEVRGSPGGEVKWLPNLLWVGGTALLILGAWLVARYTGLL